MKRVGIITDDIKIRHLRPLLDEAGFEYTEKSFKPGITQVIIETGNEKVGEIGEIVVAANKQAKAEMN